MKNTKNLYQQVLDKANQVRIEQYNKIDDMINQLTAISIMTHSLIRQLEQDPAFKYGLEPYKDLGPAFPEDDSTDPDADDVPSYTPPSGCGNCVYRDFGPET